MEIPRDRPYLEISPQQGKGQIPIISAYFPQIGFKGEPIFAPMVYAAISPEKMGAVRERTKTPEAAKEFLFPFSD